MTFFKKMIKALTPRTARQREEDWLALSSDLVELERRQKRIMRGDIAF